MPYLVDKGHEVVGVDGVETAAWQLQRDAWLTFEVSQEHAQTNSSATREDRRRPDFIAAPTFDRTRAGYVFKTDTEGTGYYLDAKAIKVNNYVEIGSNRHTSTVFPTECLDQGWPREHSPA